MPQSLSLFVAFLTNLKGWRRLAVAFGAGFAAALAFPPFNLVPVLWLSFPVLVVLLQGATRARQAFAIGWSFAFGLLVLSLYWIAGSMFVDLRSFWWAIPFAVAGLPACFALYYGLACVAAFKWKVTRGDGVFFFALCWFVAELARGHLFTGFPWDMLGYAWGDFLPVMQSVSLFGIEGLTLVTLLAVVTPALYALPVRRRVVHGAVAASVLLFLGMAAGGAIRMDAPDEMVPDVYLRLVQPNLDQALKWRSDQRAQNLETLLRLGYAAPSAKPVTHVIWPETATAYYLEEEPLVRSRIAAAMPSGSVLLTGVVRRAFRPNGQNRFFNSLIAMDAHGTVIAGYDKHHLVPFGEYMPFRSILPFPVISTMGADFSAGDGVRTLRVPDLPPFSALICYEAIFSGDVVERSDPPQFLLNVTNDGWYKGTTGPAQHFAIARARAIEEGIPLVRAANEGITGVVDSYGRPVSFLSSTQQGFVDSPLPKALKNPTLWAKHGNFLGSALFLIVLCGLIFYRNQSGVK